MKFIWESNSPWSGTGYGQQTKLLLPRLLERGHVPTCFAFYGLQGGPIDYDGYRCIPGTDFNAWGDDVIAAHLKNEESEALITLMDLFVLNQEVWSKLEKPWAAWVPIDCERVSGNGREVLKVVPYPVAMSDFGANQMREAGVEPFARIYHAVDTDVFKPMNQAECRDKLGIEQDCYLIGMVMANKGDRKQYPLQLAAIRRWMDENPDRKVMVFMHTDTSPQMGGWDMPALVEQMGLKGHVYSTDRYRTGVIPAEPEVMASIYNAFDLLLNVSSGEGFGIPIIEAQACGVPVIAHGVTAMPEIVKYGYLVEPAARGLAGHYGYQFIPNIDDLVYRLECAYRMFPDGPMMEAARAWVQLTCGVEQIANEWDEVLTAMGTFQHVSSAPETVSLS